MLYPHTAYIWQTIFMVFFKILIRVFAVSVAIVNVLSVRLAARTQVLFSVIKVGGLLVIIGGGIYSFVKGISRTNFRYLHLPKQIKSVIFIKHHYIIKVIMEYWSRASMGPIQNYQGLHRLCTAGSGRLVDGRSKINSFLFQIEFSLRVSLPINEKYTVNIVNPSLLSGET